jgi:ferredoxin
MGKGLFTSSISGRGLRKKLRSFLNGKEVKPSNKAVFNQASPASTEQSLKPQTAAPPTVTLMDDRPAQVETIKKSSTPSTDTNDTGDSVQMEAKGRDTLTKEKIAHPKEDNNEPEVESDRVLSFSERIALGKLESTIDSSISFTSGPAARQAAKELSDTVSIQTNEDGVLYWGPIDNESAQSKAAGEELIIDQEECISCGTCVENTELVFLLPDDAKAVAIQQEGPMDLIQDAIDACPVTCIHWTEDPSQYPQLNNVNGRTLT